MSDVALPIGASPQPKLDHPINPATAILFLSLLLAGILYAGLNIYWEVRDACVQTETWLPSSYSASPFSVIYTHSLAPNIAVLWSGLWNFLGVMVSTGAVAFAIISLLPVELILQVGSHAGFAMVFALLFAAIIWNLGTWYLGLPASSSHTLDYRRRHCYALMRGRDGTAGVDWGQATDVGHALLLSPIIGFIAAALLFLALKYLVHNPALYQEPKGATPPPLWIRAILVLTYTGVSFADAQVNEYGTLRKIPTAAVGNMRNDMYLVSDDGCQWVRHADGHRAQSLDGLGAHASHGDAAVGKPLLAPKPPLSKRKESRKPAAQSARRA
jgi:inorganic phosphate transporter, PiT family